MLQEQLNLSRVLMAEVSQNKQKDNEHQTVVKKNNTFFDAYSKLFVPILKGYVICKKYEHVTFSNEIEMELRKLIEDSKGIFEKKIVTAPDRYRDRVKRLYGQLENEWKEQTNTYLTDVKDELGILKLVSNEKQEIQRILNCMNNFSDWPTDTKVAMEFDKAVLGAEEILSKMEFDDDIANFLRKVKDKKASLLDLTDSIIAWIRRENLSANIMLSIKN